MISRHTIYKPEGIEYSIRRTTALLNGLASNFPKSGVDVIITEAKQARSLSQNAISHAWYATVAATEKEYTPEEIKNRCKYHFAIPMLRENPEYSEMIDKILGPLSYEDRIAAMEFIRASSLLSKKQMTDYLEAIQRHYAGRVPLEFPEAA